MVEIEVEGPDGLSPLGRVVARDEIRQLAYRYAAAIDRRAIEELASLFAPDADFGESGTGPAGAAAL
ncbi:MAG: nuclear transport factor 2 family protein, partial [Acidimicrobiia bacterium]|nr:nuclear transport factor 2 family protein [Acidimicrobiia bacterium]